MTSTSVLKSKKRLDYLPPSHTIEKVDLCFDLDPDKTLVISELLVKRLDQNASSLMLDGEALTLISVELNGRALNKDKDYVEHESGLEIFSEEHSFTLVIKNEIAPSSNTSLEGLYFTNNAFCSQCEAEGFRKITYFLDRPDVLASYRVSIRSHNPKLTYLLSNGNLIEDTGFQNGQRTCVWEDPFPKPCYLFALVAGHFDKLEDSYQTASGRNVSLQLFVDEGRLNQGQHALDSLKKSMAWDEQTYGLEYDLDIYMVVAVDFFNMGAMENKGLNVFNSKFVLADPNTATDEDYFNIESIIAHEYFHNWTGNRVTCRDWFQLSLKEGLTVFRDQQFSADMFSDLITRIGQVKVMREHQFAEDAGPMSHPIRPDEVMEMNNFYTVTVYDKGAEVIRMLHTLLGKSGFRQGMDEYFSRHDGQAVTCDDFVNAMADANNIDLTHFARWYEQSGTPLVSVKSTQSDDKNSTILHFEQVNRPTADQAYKKALYLPIKLECFDESGNKLALGLANDTFVLNKEKDELHIKTQSRLVTPSLLQDFSAPIKIDYQYSVEQLLTILRYSQSDYAKWEATQGIYSHVITACYRNELNIKQEDEDALTELVNSLTSMSISHAVLAQLLTLPSSESLFQKVPDVEPIKLDNANKMVTNLFADKISLFSSQTYQDLQKQSAEQAYAYEKHQVNTRRLKNVCLLLLAHTTLEHVKELIDVQYKHSDNMTDKLGALKAASIKQEGLFDSLMANFENEYGDDAVVMDKWFALYATASRNDCLAQLDLLQSHPQFTIKNPNKVRSLIGSFAFYNTQGFHQVDGAGYKYVADYLAELDKINPQVAARLITPFIQFASFAPTNQNLMKSQLERLFGLKGLSKDLFEKISKALATA